MDPRTRDVRALHRRFRHVVLDSISSIPARTHFLDRSAFTIEKPLNPRKDGIEPTSSPSERGMDFARSWDPSGVLSFDTLDTWMHRRGTRRSVGGTVQPSVARLQVHVFTLDAIQLGSCTSTSTSLRSSFFVLPWMMQGMCSLPCLVTLASHTFHTNR